MPDAATDKPVNGLRRFLFRVAAPGMADDQLLSAFLANRDELAFEALVRRHGPMVMGVCARILHSYQDAEDAFQATFLILARKARSISAKELLAGWLYRVAYNTALKAKAVSSKRKSHEKQVHPMPDVADPSKELSELRAYLDAELSKLPEKYRQPIVLCDLQGKTQKDAAKLLGWPEGTVSGRLSRARKMLATRLTRRGVVFSASAATATALATGGSRPPS